MTEENNQNKDNEFEYDPQIDKILVEAELKLREIEGWDNLKRYVDWMFFNKHPEFDLPVYDLKGWSKAFLYIIQFDIFIKEDTDLFNEEDPEFPLELDNEIISENDIEKYKKSLDDFRGWLERMIIIAPQAFEKLDWLKEYSPIDDQKDAIDIEDVGQEYKFYDENGIEQKVEGVVEERIYTDENGKQRKYKYTVSVAESYKSKALSFESKKKWALAIENVEKSLKAFDESIFKYPYKYSIYDFVRLPFFKHQLGDFDEAWKLFDDYLNGNFPVKTPVQNQLNHHIIKSWECGVIYRRMRVCSVREKKYKDALIYRALDLFFDIATVFFLKESNLLYQWEYKSKEDDYANLASYVLGRMSYVRDFGDELETNEDYENLLKKITTKEILNKHLKTRFRMAKLNIDLEKVSELILDAVKILPDYKAGEKLIKDFLNNEENHRNLS